MNVSFPDETKIFLIETSVVDNVFLEIDDMSSLVVLPTVITALPSLICCCAAATSALRRLSALATLPKSKTVDLTLAKVPKSIFWLNCTSRFTVRFILLSSNWIVLVKISFAGSNSISPVYTTTWKGLTFSTPVANACSIQPISSYFKVTNLPVFWTFESIKAKFSVLSFTSAGARSIFNEFLDRIGTNSFPVGFISDLDKTEFIKLLFLKSSTKNPVLKRLFPWASWICKVFVSNSNNESEVTSSKFLTLLSIPPISLIVYLRLSTNLKIASWGL